jgi:ferredoxin
MWRISVNHTCIRSGVCVGIAPERFRLDDTGGPSRPVPPDVEPDDDGVLDALASCPMEAITVVDLDTGEEVEV